MSVQVILLSGRSGVGKTSVANEMHEQLKIRHIPHAHIDGDNMDMIYPEEDGSELFLCNLAAMFENYRRLRGCTRLIISGTAMVLEQDGIRQVIEDGIRRLSGPGEEGSALDMKGFILTGSNAVVAERLEKREVGSALDAHLASTDRMAAVLEDKVGSWAIRVSTDGQRIKDTAGKILEQACWI
ncbi:uncharacterized protein BJX67DRAFT_385621 [Aspergillus lucknowensis]|uniref:APS kinase domain-containing protein n=1 Tax=Aspergillus lucknowensis TaxID=176173 RepID=A0ABR4LG98_9EURO